MFFDPAPFFGLWDLYSGPVHGELALYGNGAYLLSVWGGAQQHWGQWQIQDHHGQAVLALQVQGFYPPAFLGSMVNEPVVEFHAVLNVQPDQIRLFDASLIRHRMPSMPPLPPLPVAPIPPAPGAGTPLEFPAGPRFPDLVPQAATTPLPTIAAVARSMPAPTPPAAHDTPVMRHLAKQSTQSADPAFDAVQAIYADIARESRETDLNIAKAYAGQDEAERQAVKDNNAALTKAVHDGSAMLINNVLRR